MKIKIKNRTVKPLPKPFLLFSLIPLLTICQPTIADTAAEPTYLDQGWNTKLRELYYYTPQGSYLIPANWFKALEQASTTKSFSAPENLTKYGWITDPSNTTGLNNYNLPIGFAIDPVDQPGTGKWLGLTCSACHTGNISVKGKTIRIDGAPSTADLDVFFTDLSNAVQATLLDKSKFQRFTANVLGKNATPTDIKNLETEYSYFATTLAGQLWMRTPPIHTGPGRVDALGQIINALSVFDLKEPDNLRAPSAPVSYPFVWIAPKLDWVQWDPIASNPIARNAGEVLGVFGHANFLGSKEQVLRTEIKIKAQDTFQKAAQDLIPPSLQQKVLVPIVDKAVKDKAELNTLAGHTNKGLFSSTVIYKNIYDIEQWLVDLKEPTWQEASFGTINQDLAKQGQALFNKDCLSCHNMPPYTLTPKEQNVAGKQFIKIGRVNYKDVGTDPTYIENLLSRFTKTNDLSGLIFNNQKVVPTGSFFIGSVAAVVKQGLIDEGLSVQQQLEYSDYRFYPPKTPGAEPLPYLPPAIDDLKAGPLLGIWATGPFLHNGSVPNIYELLSPPEARSKKFWIGNRELDTEKLGFVSTENHGGFLFDTSVKGNGNQGHVYPAKPYSEAERLAVIEYLKNPLLISK